MGVAGILLILSEVTINGGPSAFCRFCIVVRCTASLLFVDEGGVGLYISEIFGSGMYIRDDAGISIEIEFRDNSKLKITTRVTAENTARLKRLLYDFLNT